MLRRIFIPLMLALVSYGLWVSPNFKEIAAGVAIFLFGMLAMEEGFKALTGGMLERLLARTTDRLWKSLCFGVVSTAVTQSSSLVSVVAISFLSAGMIQLGAGIGIIFGANLGTTTGAWLVAGFGLKVSISAYAMPLLVFGVMLIVGGSRAVRGVGYVIAGLGFLFLGIHFMKEGFEAFRGDIDLSAYAVPGFRGLITYVLLGIAATVIMQSSHATLVLTIAALATDQITYFNALALAIGSNVGTTITAMLGSLSANIDGKRLAAAHLIFNLVTGLIAVAFLDHFIRAVAVLSESAGIAGDDYTLHLAVFHTLFNLLGVVLMLPLVGLLARALTRFMPARTESRSRARYLNEATMEIPDVAVEAVRREVAHLLSNAFEVIAHGIGLHRRELLSDEPLTTIIARRSRPPQIDIDERYERTVRPLAAAILTYTSKAQGIVEDGAVEDLFALRSAGREIVEAVKGVKHLNKNLSRHMHSPNEDLRRQYDAIRLQLGEVLRQVAGVEVPTVDAVTALSLDDAKLEVVKIDERMTQAMTALIRDDRIPQDLTTSLLNDAHYATEVGLNLLSALQVLKSVGSTDTRAARSGMALDSAELRSIDDADA